MCTQVEQQTNSKINIKKQLRRKLTINKKTQILNINIHIDLL